MHLYPFWGEGNTGPHLKQNPLFGNAMHVLGVKPIWGGAYFAYFSSSAYVQSYHLKDLVESFTLMWLNISLSSIWNLKNYRNTHHPRFSFMFRTGIAFPETGVLVLMWPCRVFTRPANRHTVPMERARRELSMDMAVRGPILKLNKNMIPFYLHPKMD